MAAAAQTQLVQTIKEWIKLDNEIKVLTAEMALRRKKKTILSNTLVETMKSRDIDSFDVGGGKLMYNRRKVKKPLTQKEISALITNFYKDDQETADALQNYLEENRKTVTKEGIRAKGEFAGI